VCVCCHSHELCHVCMAEPTNMSFRDVDSSESEEP